MLPIAEQETVITYGRGEDSATIYTSDTTVMTRLDKIYKRHGEDKQGGELVAVIYVVPKSRISYRSLTAGTKPPTAAQKAAWAASAARFKAR